MSIKKVFKSYIPSVNYVTQKGRTCVFVEGRFESDHPEEISELNDVCDKRLNPHIYIDPAEVEVDTTLQDRLRIASQKAVLEEMGRIAQEKNQAQKDSQPQASPATPVDAGAGKSMSAATLLGVTNSASLTGLAKASNGQAVSVNK